MEGGSQDEGSGSSKEDEGKEKSVEGNEKEHLFTKEIVDLSGTSPVMAGSGRPLIPRSAVGPKDREREDIEKDMKRKGRVTKAKKTDTKKREEQEEETDTEMVAESGDEEDMDTEGTEMSQTDESAEGKRKSRMVKKRKAEQEPELSPVQSGTMDAFMAEVERMCKEVALIKELSEKNADTKTEIKEKARHLVKIAKKAASLKLKINLKAPPAPYNFEKVADTPNTGLGVFPTFGKESAPGCSLLLPKETGTRLCERCKDEIGKEVRIREEIERNIERVETMEEEEKRKLLCQNWPEEVYKVTNETQGRVTKEPLGVTSVILVAEEEAQRLLKEKENWMDHFTGHAGLLQRVTEGKGKTFKCRRQSALAQVDEIELEDPSVSDIYITVLDRSNSNATWDVLRTIKRITVEEEKLNMTAVGKWEAGIVRKITECVFRESNRKVNILGPTIRTQTETIVVKSEGKTFADLVKGVKEAVGQEGSTRIRNLRKTRDGSVILHTDGVNTEQMRKQIVDNVDGATAAVGGLKQVEVLDLDPTVTKGDIVDEVKKLTTQLEQNQITIDNPRMTSSGFQVANITAPKSITDRLLHMGVIRIGWTSCRLKERIKIDRCVNCLKLGHTAPRCPDGQEEKRCLKCTEKGHLASACTNEAFCISCNKKGHRNDSFTCPTYREIVQKRRAEK